MKALLEELAYQLKFKSIFNDHQISRNFRRARDGEDIGPLKTAIEKKNVGGIEDLPSLVLLTIIY